MAGDESTIVGATVAAFSTLVGYMLKSWWDERQEIRRQKRADDRARDILASDKGTNDVEEAVAQAAMEAQFARLAASARRVRESFNPPYSNGHAKVITDHDATPVEKKPKPKAR